MTRRGERRRCRALASGGVDRVVAVEGCRRRRRSVAGRRFGDSVPTGETHERLAAGNGDVRAPLGPRSITTSGLLAGGSGGSLSSMVTVPFAESLPAKRMRTVPPATSIPPGGRGPVRVTTGGSPFWVKRSGMGIAVSPQGSASMPSAMASINVGPQSSEGFQWGSSPACSMAFSSASSRVSASTVTVLW